MGTHMHIENRDNLTWQKADTLSHIQGENWYSLLLLFQNQFQASSEKEMAERALGLATEAVFPRWWMGDEHNYLDG